MQPFIQNIINGLAQGGVYALVALGYTMVYGVLQFINFAHSEVFMVGAYGGIFLTLWVNSIQGLSRGLAIAIVFLGTMSLCIVLSLCIERICYRPLRSSPRLNVLITAIGVSILLENSVQAIFDSDPRVFPDLIPTHDVIHNASGLLITNIQLIVIFASLFLMFFLNFIIHHTKIGTAMRAVSYDIVVAELMGIPTNKVIIFTFFIGSALAGSASILYAMAYPKVDPFLGMMIGIKAFIAAVFGGIGNIMGAAIGGILLGLLETFTVYYVSSSFRDAIAFGLLIIVLLFKPAGLLGTFRREKV